MGYFSNRAIDRRLLGHDHSDTPPEKQLLWRLEALEDRLCELTSQEPGNRAESDYFSKNDLRYVLPKHILSAADVGRAIDLVICDLRDRFGIYVGDASEQEDLGMDEITGMQISFLDVLALQGQCIPQSAA